MSTNFNIPPSEHEPTMASQNKHEETTNINTQNPTNENLTQPDDAVKSIFKRTRKTDYSSNEFQTPLKQSELSKLVIETSNQNTIPKIRKQFIQSINKNENNNLFNTDQKPTNQANVPKLLIGKRLNVPELVTEESKRKIRTNDKRSKTIQVSKEVVDLMTTIRTGKDSSGSSQKTLSIFQPEQSVLTESESASSKRLQFMKSNRSARDGLVHARQKFLQRQQNEKMSENFNENESDIKKRLSFLSQLKKDELERFKQEKMKKESKFKANFNTRTKQRNNTLSFGKAIKSIDITNTKDNEKFIKEHKHSKTESNNNITTPNKINNDDINTSSNREDCVNHIIVEQNSEQMSREKNVYNVIENGISISKFDNEKNSQEQNIIGNENPNHQGKNVNKDNLSNQKYDDIRLIKQQQKRDMISNDLDNLLENNNINNDISEIGQHSSDKNIFGKDDHCSATKLSRDLESAYCDSMNTKYLDESNKNINHTNVGNNKLKNMFKQSEKMLNNNDNSSLDLNNEQYFCNNRIKHNNDIDNFDNVNNNYKENDIKNTSFSNPNNVQDPNNNNLLNSKHNNIIDDVNCFQANSGNKTNNENLLIKKEDEQIETKDKNLMEDISQINNDNTKENNHLDLNNSNLDGLEKDTFNIDSSIQNKNLDNKFNEKNNEGIHNYNKQNSFDNFGKDNSKQNIINEEQIEQNNNSSNKSKLNEMLVKSQQDPNEMEQYNFTQNVNNEKHGNTNNKESNETNKISNHSSNSKINSNTNDPTYCKEELNEKQNSDNMQINYENKQSEPNKVNTGDKTVNPIENCEEEKHNYQYNQNQIKSKNEQIDNLLVSKDKDKNYALNQNKNINRRLFNFPEKHELSVNDIKHKSCYDFHSVPNDNSFYNINTNVKLKSNSNLDLKNISYNNLDEHINNNLQGKVKLENNENTNEKNMNLTSNSKYPKNNSINVTRQGEKENKEIIYNNDMNKFDPKKNNNIFENISHSENTKQLLNDIITKNNNDNLGRETLNDINEVNNIGNNLKENNKNEKSLNENRNNNQRTQNCEKEHNYQNNINENHLAIDSDSEKQKPINIPPTLTDEHLKQKYDVNQTHISDIYKQYENNGPDIRNSDPQKLIETNKVKSHLNPSVNNNNNNISSHEDNETNANNYFNLNEQKPLNEPKIRENKDSMNNKINIPYEKIINNKADVPSSKINEEGITNKKENLQENNNNDIEDFNTSSNKKNISTVTSENKNAKNDIACFPQTNESNLLNNVSEKHKSNDNEIILNNSNKRGNNDEIIIPNDNPTGEGQNNSTDEKVISTNIQPKESNENNFCFGTDDNNSERIIKNNEQNKRIYEEMEKQKTSHKTNKESNIIQLIEIQSQKQEGCDNVNNNSITLLYNNKTNTITEEKNIKNKKDEENCELYQNNSIKETKELSENEKQNDSINTNFNITKINPLLNNVNKHIIDESQVDSNFNDNKSNIKLVQPINTDGELKQVINENNGVTNNMNSNEENTTPNKNIGNNSLNIIELPFSDNNNNKLFDNENQAYQNQKNKNEYKNKENSSDNNKETKNNLNNESSEFANKLNDGVDMPSLHTQNIITTAIGDNEQSNISKKEIYNNTNEIENSSRNKRKKSTNNEIENKFDKNTNTFKDENPNLIISQSLSNKELNKIGNDISFNPNTSNYKYTFENVCENDIDALEIKEEENECIVNNEKSKEDITKEQSTNANEFTNSKINNNNHLEPSNTINNNKTSNYLDNPKEKEKDNSNYSCINKEEIDDVKKLNSQMDSQTEKKESDINKKEIPNITENLTSDNNFINHSTKDEIQPTQTNNKENINNSNNNNISFKNNQIIGQINKKQQIEKNTNSLNNVVNTNITPNNHIITNTSPQDISTKSNQNHPQNSFKTNPKLLQIKTTKPSLSENTRYFSNNNNESQKNIINNNNNNHALQNENFSKQNNLLNPNTKPPSTQTVPLLNFSKLNQNESTLTNNLSIIPPKNKRNHSRVLSSPFLSESIFNSETGQFISQKSISNINNNNDIDSKFKFPGSPILLSNKPYGIINEETNPLLRACSSRDIIYLYQNKKQPIKSSTHKSNTLFNKTKPKPSINTYNISSIPFSYPTVHNAAPNSHRLNTLNTMCKDLQKTESNINDKQKNLQGRLQFLSKFVKDSNALSPPHNNNKANVMNTDANLKTRNYETIALISSPRQQEINKKEIFYIKDNANSILPPNALNYSKYGFFKSN